VSRELNVRQVLAKVRLGEADAGFVYRSDAAVARAHVRCVGIPPELTRQRPNTDRRGQSRRRIPRWRGAGSTWSSRPRRDGAT